MILVNEAICKICGKTFVKEKYQSAKKYCSEECCEKSTILRKKEYYVANRDVISRRSEEYKKKKKRKAACKKYSNKKAIIDIAALARKEGLSYGQYVAKYGVQSMNDGTKNLSSIDLDIMENYPSEKANKIGGRLPCHLQYLRENKINIKPEVKISESE